MKCLITQKDHQKEKVHLQHLWKTSPCRGLCSSNLCRSRVTCTCGTGWRVTRSDLCSEEEERWWQSLAAAGSPDRPAEAAMSAPEMNGQESDEHGGRGNTAARRLDCASPAKDEERPSGAERRHRQERVCDPQARSPGPDQGSGHAARGRFWPLARELWRVIEVTEQGGERLPSESHEPALARAGEGTDVEFEHRKRNANPVKKTLVNYTKVAAVSTNTWKEEEVKWTKCCLTSWAQRPSCAFHGFSSVSEAHSQET